jgi:hypothetical protein
MRREVQGHQRLRHQGQNAARIHEGSFRGFLDGLSVDLRR